MNIDNSQAQNKVSPIYLLPNMITLGAMFCGFYAIIQSINESFVTAGIAILFAMILDSLDGRVARLTGTSSPFGAELDSLSDMVNFGIAPAVIAFNWQLYTLGKFGWLVSFIYSACAALRLARFNTMIAVNDKRYFTGIPSPAGAALVVGYVYMCANYNFHNIYITILGVIVILISAFSMVSNVKFYSFKEFNFHRTGKFRALIAFLVALSLLTIWPDFVIYGFFVGYTFVSYFLTFTRMLKSKRLKRHHHLHLHK
jgi:CDP-diacylglycerol---serine O-phosphatidyltransferase